MLIEKSKLIRGTASRTDDSEHQLVPSSSRVERLGLPEAKSIKTELLGHKTSRLEMDLVQPAAGLVDSKLPITALFDDLTALDTTSKSHFWEVPKAALALITRFYLSFQIQKGVS